MKIDLLKWIVKKKMSRIYDVFSIILFSAAVNIITSSFSTSAESYCYYIFYFSSFIAFTCAGWCYYSLYYKVEEYFNKHTDGAVLNKIEESKESSIFKGYFIVGAICFAFGVLFLAIIRLQ